MTWRLELSEAEVTRTVLEMAEANGWPLRYHVRDSRGSVEGFPDWVFLRPGRLTALELKGWRTRVAPAQRVWVEMLATVPGVEAAIIQPADLALAAHLLRR